MLRKVRINIDLASVFYGTGSGGWIDGVTSAFFVAVGLVHSINGFLLVAAII
jgi:hypothetical protein